MDMLTLPAVTDLPALETRISGLRGDLRSDHAGETGAVMIYRGILAGSRDAAVRRFATAHLATEQRHLDLMDGLLPPAQRSLLLPLWRIAGFLTGFLPACAGTRAVYATIDAVETFVDHHYAEQIAKLPASELRTLLATCQADEVHHRDEARALSAGPPGIVLRAWVWLVGFGSRNAVAAARRM
jgi:ubiquinone biosynthesis monooxygenase Coq7